MTWNRTLRDYLTLLRGLELRQYTRTDCEAATALWCSHLSRQERSGLVQFLMSRVCRGEMSLAVALMVRRRP